MSMDVTEWISMDEAEDKPESVGGLGGWFSEGMRWRDYFEDLRVESKPYIEAIRKEVILKGIRATGEEHQRAYVPVFSDGTVGRFSWRAWGDLMAAIWSEQDNRDYSYMSFYM